MQSYFAWNLYSFLDEEPTFIDVLDSVVWLVWRLSSFVIHAESQKTSKSARSLKVIYFFRSGIRWSTERTTRWLKNREVILSYTLTVVWFDFTMMNDDDYNKYDQVWGQDVWILAKVIFRVFHGPRRIESRSINSQKKRPRSCHLDRANLVKEGFIIWLSVKFFLWDTTGSPERAR